MLLPTMPSEGFGGLQITRGLGALLVDQAAEQLFHRHADLARFALALGRVARIDVWDGNAGTHVGGSGSVNSLLATDRTC